MEEQEVDDFLEPEKLELEGLEEGLDFPEPLEGHELLELGKLEDILEQGRHKVLSVMKTKT